MSTIVLTGASDGIGRAAAIAFAREGHRLVLVGRNPSKVADVVAAAEAAGGRDVVGLVADFAELAQVRRVAAEIRSAVASIDVLINNAGTVFHAREITVDGNEATFQVNHLGSVLLTEALVDLIPAGGRVVITASSGHTVGKLDFSDLLLDKGYQYFMAYGRSKLCNVLMARYWAREFAERQIVVNSFHPGAVSTSIWSGAPKIAEFVIDTLVRRFLRSSEKGAETMVWLATSDAAVGLSGGYYIDCVEKPVSKLARVDELGVKLVAVSHELIANA
ncbi:MAG: SDR family NAD(P)-dependent oxidoreductase [Marmoricola sp.]